MVAVGTILIGSGLLVIVGLLFYIAYRDARTFNTEEGYIPSVITTVFLSICFLFKILFYPTTETLILFVIAVLFALLFFEMDFYRGEADMKVVIGTALLFSSFYFIIYMVGLAIMTLFVSLLIMRKREIKAYPYIPFITLTFGIAYLAQYLLTGRLL